MDETLANPWQEVPPPPGQSQQSQRGEKERKKGRKGGGTEAEPALPIKRLWDAAGSER